MAKNFNAGSILGAGVGAIGSIAGNIINNKNADKALAAAREENELSRKFNKEQSEQANQWSREQWDRENAYNTPAEQMSRLRSGGLNADLVYGNGATTSAANSPSVTPTASASPADTSALSRKKSTLSTVGESAMQAAQIGLINAQTNKLEAETTGQETSNDWLSKINGNSIQLQNAQINNLNMASLKTDAEREKLNTDITKINTEVDALKTQIDSAKQSISESKSRQHNITFQQEISRLNYALQNKKTMGELSRIAKQNGLDDQQISNMQQTLPFVIQQMMGSASDSTSSAMLKDSQRLSEILKRQGIQIQNGNLILNGQILQQSAKNASAYDQGLDSLGIVGANIRTMTQFLKEVLGGSIGSLLK